MWRLEVCQRVMDAVEVQAGAAAVLAYARSGNPIDLDLTSREIAAALRACQVVNELDFGGMVAGWTISQSIYGTDAH